MSKGWKLPQTRLLKQYKIFSLLQKLEVQVAQLVENPPGNAGDTGDGGLIPGSGKVLGGGNGNPFHYSCLGNPMDRGAWWATVHEAAKSWTRLRVCAPVRVCAHTHTGSPGPVWQQVSFFCSLFLARRQLSTAGAFQV